MSEEIASNNESRRSCANLYDTASFKRRGRSVEVAVLEKNYNNKSEEKNWEAFHAAAFLVQWMTPRSQ